MPNSSGQPNPIKSGVESENQRAPGRPGQITRLVERVAGYGGLGPAGRE